MQCTMLREGGPEAGHELALARVPSVLAPYIESCIGYREWSSQPVQRLELPSGRAVLIFELGPPIALGAPGSVLTRYRHGFYAAIGDEPTLTAFKKTQEGIQVTLTPRGAHALLGRETPDLTGLVTELGALRLAEPVGEVLAGTSCWHARIAVVLRALAPRLLRARDQSDVVRWAVERIDRGHGTLRIDALCNELGYSRKHLHAKFLDEVGVPPKRYAALRRFHHVVEHLRAGPVESFAQLAVQMGYSDQAHLAREARRFSGASTTALARLVREPIAVAFDQLTSRVESGA